MKRIRIRNFGPIRVGFGDNDGWMEIKKVTLMTGNQGAGKSTVAKLISTISWIEKAIVRGDVSESHFLERGRFENHCEYQNIQEYFNQDTEIGYEGNMIKFSYLKGVCSIELKTFVSIADYLMPKIMYVPAERNFISAVRNLKNLKGLPGTIYTLGEEYVKAIQSIRGAVPLPINNVHLEYQRLNDIASIVGTDFKIRLMSASSGFQSLVPLYIVSKYLAESVIRARNYHAHSPNNDMSIAEREQLRDEIKTILDNPNLSDVAKQIQIELKSSRFEYGSFLNVVEEPEQNLYPVSQRQILNSLLELNNIMSSNLLVMTTHSPYLIYYLTLAIKAGLVYNELSSNDANEGLINEVLEIVPLKSFILPDELAIYELSEKDGSISLLKTFKGIPSDDNNLNELLGDFNDLYSHLVNIQNKRK